MIEVLAFVIFFAGGVVIGRATASARPRGLIDGEGLNLDRAARRPALRDAFREDRRRRR